ncbi:hypothetical protein [Microbacterium sp. CPCC 204701]|uniref:hypothetical protein n=1 Tax=Microbacterium sp. CPCC 204701 TaxID=2493084 RepID=UPI00197B53E2|nr:hypothetical protein [Microbacterium sp. CPCC 204701]
MTEWWDDSVRGWRSGEWSLELRDDEFADIAYDGHVVLRSVRAVIRDRNWDTAALVVDRVDESDLALTLHVHSEGLGSDLRGIVRAEVRGAGRLRVLTDLESATDFETNRTGLVVLHPPVLAGAELDVRHPGGDALHTRFPARISPHQPAFDIAGLSWSHDGLDVDLHFAGDVFEMEDQRNWTDASYKTYSRPLALPFPYPLAAGERVVQSIDVTVSGAPMRVPADAVARIRLEDGPALPAIAVSAATAPDPAPARIDPAPWSAVIVELDLATRNWRAALRRAAASALPLDVRFVLADDDTTAIDDAAHALRDLPVARVTAFWPTGPARHVSDLEAIALLRHALTEAGVDALVVGGVRSHFTELNREHQRLPRRLDGVVFSSTPLFHSLGTAQLIEALQMQRLVATQGVELAGGPLVHIGPISLRPHFNDVATTPPPMPSHDDLRDGYGSALTVSTPPPDAAGASPGASGHVGSAADPRQSAAELAAWTVASAAAFAVPGVATLAYFEEWGPRGVRGSDGTPFPVFDAVTALAELAQKPGLRGDSPDGLVWALGARTEEGTTVLIANLDRRERRIEAETPAGSVTATLAAGTLQRLFLPAVP